MITKIHKGLYTIAMLILMTLLMGNPSRVQSKEGRRQPYPPLPELRALQISQSDAWSILETDEIDPPEAQAVLETASARNYWRMVYQSYRDENWEIYGRNELIYNASTKRLTTDGGADILPHLNQGADLIIFTSLRDGNAEIYRMNWDGGEVVNLTINDAYDSQGVWSPDGTRIAFVSERDGTLEIYTMNSDGSDPVRLTYFGGQNFSPTWSPDGSKIAWLQAVSEDSAMIAVMNKDGSGAEYLYGPLRYAADLNWSTTGSRFALDYDSNGDGWNDLAIINTDGSGALQILRGGETQHEYWAGSWIVNDEALLYTHVNYTEYEGEYYIHDGEIHDYGFSGGGTSYYGWHLDFNPNAQPNDLTEPSSYVKHLPLFSRASGFPVEWSGYDPGPAPIERFDIQTRVGTHGGWTTWINPDRSIIEAVYSGTPGDTVYFRSRATDAADHVESQINPNGDTHTTLYTYQIAGRVWDNRSKPVPDASLAISPESINLHGVDLSGEFDAYLENSGLYSIQANQTGYGSLPPSAMDIQGDASISIVLPPLDDQIANGGFESDFDGWIGGQYATLSEGHSGGNSASLGLSCEEPCLVHGSVNGETDPNAPPDAAVDNLGYVHLIWNHTYYSMRDLSGNWSVPVNLGDFGESGSSDNLRSTIAVDSKGKVHVAIRGDDELVYLQKPKGGSWSEPETILPTGKYPDIAVDRAGNVYLTYFGYYEEFSGDWSMFVRRDAASGSWSAPDPVSDSRCRMTIGADNALHFICWDWDGSLYYDRILGNDHQSKHLPFAATEGASISVDPSGSAHVLAGDRENWVYFKRDPITGSWSQELLPDMMTEEAGLISGADGGIHIVGTSDNLYEMIYMYKPSTGSHFTHYNLSAGAAQPKGIGMAAGKTGAVHMFWLEDNGLEHTTQMLAYQSLEQTLMQSVYITPSLHLPTLAFQYRLASNQSWSESGLTVEADTGEITQTLMESTAASDWQPAWVDLSPFTGESITLTFKMTQVEDEPIVHLSLDEVSLGSWLTPVIQAVDPAQATDWEGLVITVTGDNFFPTPALSLDGVPLSDVVWIDENTIQATLPDGLEPGIYTLWLTNPGGQTAALGNAIQLGSFAYLPLLSSNYQN